MKEDKADISAAPPNAQPMQSSQFEGDSTALLQMLCDQLDIGVAILDEDLRYRLISTETYKQLGATSEELSLGDHLNHCHDLMYEKGLMTDRVMEESQLAADLQSKLSKDGTDPGIRYVKLGDGSTHRFVRRTLENGYTVSMASNVTQLIQKHELLDASLTLGSAGYWIYDFATKSYQLSESINQLLRPQVAERIHTHGIIAIIHPEDRPMFYDALANMTKGDGKFEVESRSVTKTGHDIWSRTTGELIRDPAGRPVQIRAFVKNITREREQQQALRRAKDEAIAASQAKSEFLANMSHEIRTPMNGVLGMAELLAATDITPRQREFVSVINNSAAALLDIINDILDFSKIEAGAMELDPIPFDLKNAISDVASLMRAQAQTKGLELIINYPPSLPAHFIGDAGRLRQVMTNLIGNAIKFTENGQIQIDVKARVDELRAFLTVEVTDTGIGIEPEKLEYIFNKFTQADGSTTRLYGGTGLGLTITRHIIKMMGGGITVSSALGKGSKFSFQLPLEIDTQAKPEKYDTRLLHGKRALIIDDIESNRQILQQQIANWGIDSDAAADGIEALTMIKQAQDTGQAYDILLLDYLMPGVNGQELAKMLWANPNLGRMPIIMLSSCDQTKSSQDLRDFGINSYLVKPVRERLLFDTLVRTFSNPVEAGAQDPEVPQTAEANTPKKQDILVAEDFPLNQEVIRLMLADSDYEPVFASNGQDALKTFSDDPDRFPVILMDVSMPVMDGYDATKEIRAFETRIGRDPVPIVALTGHALKNDRQICIDAGMNDYLTKPVKQIELIEKLDHYTIHGLELQAIA